MPIYQTILKNGVVKNDKRKNDKKRNGGRNQKIDW